MEIHSTSVMKGKNLKCVLIVDAPETTKKGKEAQPFADGNKETY